MIKKPTKTGAGLYKIGNVSFDPKAVLELGKTEFVRQHPHVNNPGDLFEQIKKAFGKE